MLWGYFDESGKFSDSDFVCLCGFLSSNTWDNFCAEWREQLGRDGFSSLHMARIDWRDEQKLNSLNDFVAVIRRHVLFGYGVAVDVKYFRTMPLEKRKLLGDKDPRDFTFHQLLRLVREDLRSLDMDDWLSLSFDYEEGFSVECLRSLIKLRSRYDFIRSLVQSIGFADDEFFYPLQAADLFAYGYKRFLQGNAPEYWKEFSKPITSDNPGPKTLVSYFDATHLEDVCEQARKMLKTKEPS